MISHTKSPLKPKDDQALMTELWDENLYEDLRAFVMFVYPWGKANTPLEKFKEPRRWQIDEFEKMTAHIKANKERIQLGLNPEVYHSATVSGRGSGKSAFVAMIEHWMMTSVLGSSTLVTANTEVQLRTKTWPEVGKWLTMAINHHWFDKTALSVIPAPWFEKELSNQLKVDTGYYFGKALTWSEENPDAFAGQHNTLGTLIVFDEASGIPQPIWDVSEGFFTEPALHRYWFAFSNGRRNTGPFFECFHKNRNFWANRRHIDSRTVEGMDHAPLQRIIDQYGEDSDQARVEVRGMFPRQGDMQFISRELVEDAQIREVETDKWAPIIMGVDPARGGNDEFVIRFRQGRDARSFPVIVRKGIDNMVAANLCAEWINKINPDAVCIDAGNGTGIIDRLRELKFKVNEIWFGSSSSKPEWMNKRTEMWDDMRQWLRGGTIDKHETLSVDLTAPEYKFAGRGSDVIRLETKDEMKVRGFASPNHGDALALTFAVNVARKDRSAGRFQNQSMTRVAKDVDYSIFS